MPSIEIYWDDLTEAKQKEILEALGDNGNYDVFPLATLEHEYNLNTPLNVNLIATYEEIYGIPEDEKLTEYFGEYGSHFFKAGISDRNIRPVLDKALEAMALTEDEYNARYNEFIYRLNVEKEMSRQIDIQTLSM